MTTLSFSDRVFAVLIQVPAGKVTTYGDIAAVLGTRAFRAVGQVLHRNMNAPEVPCHRVVGATGVIGGYAFGLQRKIKLLQEEGISVADGKVVDFSKCRHQFSNDLKF